MKLSISANVFINSATCSAPWEVSQIELQTNHVGLAFEFFFQRKNLTEQSQRQIHLIELWLCDSLHDDIRVFFCEIWIIYNQANVRFTDV